MLFIVIISAVVFILSGTGPVNLISFFGFNTALIMQGQVWRLFTWVFTPISSSILWVAVSLYFYYFIGSSLEREWGAGKFTIYYLFGVLLNIIYGFLMWLVFNMTVTLSPMYLNLSMFFAFATLFPDVSIRLFFVIPIKIKWLALVNAILFFLSIIMGIVAGEVLLAFLPVVALLNYILICGDDLLSYIRPMVKVRTSPQVVNFKKAAKQVKKDLTDKPYRHKCAVCGKTDTDYPELEFRYCSRCNGYHCFCSEHINNHIHFTEQ